MKKRTLPKIFAIAIALLGAGKTFGQTTTLRVNTPLTNTDARAIISPSSANDPDPTDGFIVPRINAFPGNASGFNSAPGSNSKGMLVYLQQQFTGDANAAGYVNGQVYSIGYYYWNGTQWAKLVSTVNNTSSGGDSSIYNSNGTLLSSRVVTMNANSLTFGATTGNLVYLPTGSGSMGIGTSSPAAKLDVNGNMRIATTASGASTDSILTVNASTGIVNRRSLASVQSGSANLYNSDGSLTGARTVTMGANALSFTGTSGDLFSVSSSNTTGTSLANLMAPSLATGSYSQLRVGQSATNNNSAEIHFNYAGSGSSSNSLGLGFYGVSDLVRLTAAGNVGIGNTSPAAKLDVSSAVSSSPALAHLMAPSLSNGSNAAFRLGQSLTSNNAAELHFNYAGSGSSSNNLGLGFYGTGDIAYLTAGGNMGIGTSSPAAKLDVNGQIKIQGGSPGAGKVLVSDNNGLATWAAPQSVGNVKVGNGAYTSTVPNNTYSDRLPMSTTYAVDATLYSVGNNVITFTTSGTYQITFCAAGTSSNAGTGGGILDIGAWKNGNVSYSSNGSYLDAVVAIPYAPNGFINDIPVTANFSSIMNFSAGDTFQLIGHTYNVSSDWKFSLISCTITKL